MQTIRCVSRGWHQPLASLVNSARRNLLVCSPFVGREGTGFVASSLASGFCQDGCLTFLTNLSVDNVCRLATDPRALRSLVEVVSHSAVFHLPGLHAKAYIADDTHALVTSGNLTAGGLYRNHEYGLEITDRVLVRKIRRDLLDYAELGAAVPHDRISVYCETVDELYESIVREHRAAERNMRRRFREAIRPIEDDLLRLRLAGGPIHTVFARTIEYLLRSHGPLSTVEIHPMIAAIHPDLCDNSVDRVIDGKRFGKKWKHAVRTAQQQLKKQGRITYANGKWSFA